MREQLKEAVDILCDAEQEQYEDYVRVLKSLHILPVKARLIEPEVLNSVLDLDDERFATFLQIVAVRRDKLYKSDRELWRREYMRDYMRKRRKANPLQTRIRRAPAR